MKSRVRIGGVWTRMDHGAVMRALVCAHCHEARDTVRPRRSPNGDEGRLCAECWNDLMPLWPWRRDV